MAKRDTLGSLFGSEARVRMLRLFLMNPDNTFDLSSIASRLSLRRDQVRREVKMLLDIGYVKQLSHISRKGKKTKKSTQAYALMRGFPYLNELAALLASSAPPARERILSRIRGIGKVTLLVMSGCLLGYNTDRVDIFIVGDALRRKRIERMLHSVEAEIGREITYAMMPTREFQYRHGLYDRFIKDLFDNPHEILINKLDIQVQKGG